MCAPGCSNAWIADKYCDQVRNVNEDLKSYPPTHTKIARINCGAFGSL